MIEFSVTVYTDREILSEFYSAYNPAIALEKLLEDKHVNASDIKSCLIAPVVD